MAEGAETGMDVDRPHGPPLVSIVTPSYNQGPYIRAAIESVLSQDYPNIEYAVIDGGSSDETVDILKGYGGRLRWVSERDRGQADAVNKGIRGTSGAIIGWLNSDDVYLPGAVTSAVEFLERNPSVAAVYGEGYHITKDGSVIERYPTEPFDRERLKETCYICQPAVFMRRQAVMAVGLLDEGLGYCMDYDLWIRLARGGDLGYIPSYLACTRLYAETKTLGKRVEAHSEILDVVKRHYGVVAPSWIYAYAHAALERRMGVGRPARGLVFTGRLIGLSAVKFIEYNRRLPLGELRRCLGWLKRGVLNRMRKNPK
jgi:glycosyltransferase involved in cell wall biosynthesis